MRHIQRLVVMGLMGYAGTVMASPLLGYVIYHAGYQEAGMNVCGLAFKLLGVN